MRRAWRRQVLTGKHCEHGWAEGQTRLERAFEGLSEAELAEPREWEGMTQPLARLFSYLIEHDFYHAGQIELLRQIRGYPSGAD